MLTFNHRLFSFDARDHRYRRVRGRLSLGHTDVRVLPVPKRQQERSEFAIACRQTRFDHAANHDLPSDEQPSHSGRAGLQSVRLGQADFEQ